MWVLEESETQRSKAASQRFHTYYLGESRRWESHWALLDCLILPPCHFLVKLWVDIYFNCFSFFPLNGKMVGSWILICLTNKWGRSYPGRSYLRQKGNLMCSIHTWLKRHPLGNCYFTHNQVMKNLFMTHEKHSFHFCLKVVESMLENTCRFMVILVHSWELQGLPLEKRAILAWGRPHSPFLGCTAAAS